MTYKITRQRLNNLCVGGLKTYTKFDYHMADGTFFTPIRNRFDVDLLLQLAIK